MYKIISKIKASVGINLGSNANSNPMAMQQVQ